MNKNAQTSIASLGNLEIFIGETIPKFHNTMYPVGKKDYAGSRKVNLGRNLRCVAKQTPKFSRKKTQAKKKACPVFIGNNRLMDVTHLALTWVGQPNGEKLESTYAQI